MYIIIYDDYYYYYYLKCTYVSDTVTLNVLGALYTVKGIMENSTVD